MNQQQSTSKPTVDLPLWRAKTQRPSILPTLPINTRKSYRRGVRRTQSSRYSCVDSYYILTKSRFPGEVVVTDIVDDASSDNNTPAGEPGDDFFSSWDKPTIKRPSNPPSRTGTPSNVSRTASPFLNAGGSNGSRPKSPLNASSTETGAVAPTSAPRTVTTSSAIRKTAATGAARKTNVLGAKKNKLGAKKVPTDADLDFEAAERKAKEEAERIAKLGYNPDDEVEAAAAASKSTPVVSAEAGKIVSPTPMSPGRSGATAAKGMERTSAEMERLGMGMGRLGFGQTASKKPAASKIGFGQTTRAAPQEGESLCIFQWSSKLTYCVDTSNTFAREKFGTQKGISSDEFFGREAFDPSAQQEAKSRLQGFEGATSISSNAYFGRPEADFSADDYGDLESAAKDFVRRFGITAGDDLENLTHVLGEGASKLQGAIRNYLNG
jgi:ADP-ribosylation factor GTPase-activating protein 2/3